ncbi:hypothetical protein MNEG_4002 [Monoraphidium neglectum]|uniref:VOC domain-containing protein n=1 Tax=Monoraphidium neglectum TaxID=145388 RepID=A0A0D2LAZ7_9CHLO|nr:hypothetical protein MNEG_4002 [Monoraphidium neglectum]KIZ03954.1 hypothetical protein MNEG_4002 [Monoraphidium neglectum]|eukprot:XP_013902973.1 hypothetical protein MNEG_4002 [Monoraphidium neglectum]
MAAEAPSRARRVAPPLRALASHATAPAARGGAAGTAAARALDVGNVIALEHINIEVPDLEAARLFYSEGLGFTIDPDTTGAERSGARGLGVVWYNLNRQQLHICRGPEPQRLPAGGAIGLVVHSVERVAAQLEVVQSLLGEVTVAHLGPGVLEVRDPWGSAYIVREAGDATPAALQAGGISEVLLPCHLGAAVAIGRFYERVLGARVDYSAGQASVVVGAGSALVFKEDGSLGQRSDQAVAALHTGWHAAIYVADFSGVFSRVEALGLIDNNHPYRDKCYSIEDALRNKQFRFKDVLALREGGSDDELAKEGLAYVLNHEVRSMHHPRFVRPLYNRQPPRR